MEMVRYETQALKPTTLSEANTLANVIANSSFCPNTYRGKPGDVLVCIMMGCEVGLSPMQSIQNIAVINGKPSLWGDAALGVCKSHPSYESCDEWLENEGDALTAYCKARRKGEEPQVRSFSVDDAKKAGLWGKQGPWSNYPKRMLQMRARGFAIRDVWPDALRGLITAEEAQDMPHVKDVTPAEEKQRAKEIRSKSERIAEKIGASSIKSVVVDAEQYSDALSKAYDAIDASKSEGELLALTPMLESLTAEEKEQVKPYYKSKREALRVFLKEEEARQPSTGDA